MAETKSAWSFVEISPEAREAAERAAAAAGMDLDAWLAQLVKYTSAMELKAQSGSRLPAGAPPASRPPDSRPPDSPPPAAPLFAPQPMLRPAPLPGTAPQTESPRPIAASRPEAPGPTALRQAVSNGETSAPGPSATGVSQPAAPAAPLLNFAIGPSRHATGEDLPLAGPRPDPPPLNPPGKPPNPPPVLRNWGRAPLRAAPPHAAPEPDGRRGRVAPVEREPARRSEWVVERPAEKPVEVPPFAISPVPARPTVTMPQRPAGSALSLSLRPAMAEDQRAYAAGFGEPAPPQAVAQRMAAAPAMPSPIVAPATMPPVAAPSTDAAAPAAAAPLRLPLRASSRPIPERAADPAAEIPGGRSAAEQPHMVATDTLQPSRFAALASPKEEDIQAALDRWRASGMLEPLVVRSRAGAPGAFEIISGIDRWHAARRAYVRQIPVLVREMGDQEALEQGLVDQLRRGPISPLTEANIYLRLLNDAGLDTVRAARLAGKQPGHVATMVRILNLPKSVRAMLEKGEITVMHARALLEAPNPDAIARDIVEKRLDIYQTEQLVRIAGRNAETVDPNVLQDAPSDESIEELGTAPFAREARPLAGSTFVRTAEVSGERGEPPLEIGDEPRPAGPSARRPSESRTPREDDVISTDLLERNIANALGVRCAISEKNGVGVITLHYTSREELVRILARINSGGASG